LEYKEDIGDVNGEIRDANATDPSADSSVSTLNSMTFIAMMGQMSTIVSFFIITGVILTGVGSVLGLKRISKKANVDKQAIIDYISGNKQITESFVINLTKQIKPLNEAKERHSMLIKYGVEGFNKPKATPSHKTKSHLVVAKKGDDIKVVRFGAQGVKGSPKKDGESEAYRKRRQGFVARHKAQNPEGMKDKFSPLY
jgi:hypothetical protein